MNKQPYSGPKYLYKYRPLDEHAFDMLENEYVWLSKASSLDDPTECKVTINEENYFDLVNDTIRREVVDQLLEFLYSYSSKETNERCKQLIYQCMTPDFRIRNNFLLDVSFDLKELAPDVPNEMIVNLVNWMASIPKLIDEPNIKPQFETLLLAGLDAREKMGICSFADSPNNEELWKNYAKDSTGYCVEYEMEGYEYNNLLFPVDYVEERQTNLVVQLVISFIGQMITQLSNNQLQADKSSYLRLFTTKNINWDYQKEWRLLGDANTKQKAPKIKTIYLGKNVSKENEEKINELAKRNGYEVRKGS
ncbi:MAG: DUF2971 domain-containing protein [Bacilli bacterium]